LHSASSYLSLSSAGCLSDHEGEFAEIVAHHDTPLAPPQRHVTFREDRFLGIVRFLLRRVYSSLKEKSFSVLLRLPRDGREFLVDLLDKNILKKLAQNSAGPELSMVLRRLSFSFS